MVFDEIKVFWDKARIPTSRKQYVRKKVIDLYDEWMYLKKPKKAKKFPKELQQERDFVDKLDDLFDIAALNALQTLKGIDKEFLLSQREKGRVGCLIGIDEAGEQLEARRLERADEEENRKRKHAIESKQQFVYLFRGQFVLTDQEENGLRDVCIFLALLYVEAWYTCKSGVSAPNNDLNFIKKAFAYEAIDKNVSNLALKKISLQLWYLSDEALAFSFFDETIPIEVKKKWSAH